MSFEEKAAYHREKTDAEFDRLAAASSDEVLRDEDFPRMGGARKLELVFLTCVGL
jgi:hypothetical protein